MYPLGFKGEEQTLIIRQGADFGPYPVELVYEGGAAVNLAGCTLSGHIRKSWNSPDAAAEVDFDIIEAAAGRFSFSMPHTVTETLNAGETELSPESHYVWQADVTDAAGNVRPLYWGDVLVYRKLAI